MILQRTSERYNELRVFNFTAVEYDPYFTLECTHNLQIAIASCELTDVPIQILLQQYLKILN